MSNRARGFSVIEVIIALGITLGTGVILFQVFRQNERILRDQDLVVEAQQSARAVASQIADEIRMAGQGVPLYASTFDSSPTEAVSVFLTGTGSTRVNFRAGLANIESDVTSAVPLDVALGTARTIDAFTSLPFTDSVGKFVYIQGPGSGESWAWARAELNQVANSTNTLRVTPRQGRDSSGDGNVIRFNAAPTITLEEAVAFYFESGSIKRATATSLSDPDSPVWSAGSEIGRGFTSLAFTYYDKNNNVIVPDSMSARMSIARVDFHLNARTGTLSDGQRQDYPLLLRTIPRSLKIF